jgi:hypothetical protein
MKNARKLGKLLSKEEQKKINGRTGENCLTENQTGCGPGNYCCAGLTCVIAIETCKNIPGGGL